MIRVISGDNELSALEFQKHYRLGIVHLLDSDRSFERLYHRGGWPFLMLVDKSGRVSWKGSGTVTQEGAGLDERIRKLARGVSAPKPLEREGVSYMRATLKRSGEVRKGKLRESFCSVACSSDGKVYAAFTSNRNGNSDVFVRAYDGETWGDDVAAAGTEADEFDGTVMVDKENRAWVSWTSNAGSRRYDIFVKPLSGPGSEGEAKQLTRSRDDAMHARMACDGQGRIWITYYKWHKMRQTSRDKEVYLRCYDGKRWSGEVQVSPKDVPEYEDHSDPVVAGLDDGALVGWSWDFHQPKGYPKSAKEPSIFVRRIAGSFRPGKAAAVSTKAIDVTPVIGVVDGGDLWCAWDSLGGRSKSLCVRQISEKGSGQGKVQRPGGGARNVCSPSFAAGPDGVLTLVWSQTGDGRNWELKRSDLSKGGRQWSKAVSVRSEGNPRFCSAGYDSKGRLWIACSVETEAGREVEVMGPYGEKVIEKKGQSR